MVPYITEITDYFVSFRGDSFLPARPALSWPERPNALSRIRSVQHYLHLSRCGGPFVPTGPGPLLRGGPGGPGEQDRLTDRRHSR